MIEILKSYLKVFCHEGCHFLWTCTWEWVAVLLSSVNNTQETLFKRVDWTDSLFLWREDSLFARIWVISSQKWSHNTREEMTRKWRKGVTHSSSSVDDDEEVSKRDTLLVKTQQPLMKLSFNYFFDLYFLQNLTFHLIQSCVFFSSFPPNFFTHKRLESCHELSPFDEEDSLVLFPVVSLSFYLRDSFFLDSRRTNKLL